eukprot:CAMPEP_0184484190 /NCGR_PEP_ID=MMETSP0113_2-20130426/5898_1 /TAXON_ID=91329 /ORGANISM="Norrisiella sphaerica, Strain BC52" /LENGTH=526 /DNA_ID=CAMNT_0026865055 /DNA_START=176 /DNA_END=1756 /DNA_ORIENTATION=-
MVSKNLVFAIFSSLVWSTYGSAQVATRQRAPSSVAQSLQQRFRPQPLDRTKSALRSLSRGSLMRTSATEALSLNPEPLLPDPKTATKAESESALLDEIMMDIKSLSTEGEMLRRPSISTVFFIVLSSVLFSVVSPASFPEEITEVLVPVAASIIAVCTTAAEFQGKDATADAKEVAAVALAQAARSEAYLSRAEKAKAVLPALVGISATAATLNLVFPAIMAGGITVNPLLIGTCPVVGTMAAAVAAIASVETLASGYLALGKVSADRAISVKEAGSTDLRFKALRQRTIAVAKHVAPAFLIGLFMPGDFVFRCIVAAAASAVSVAYNLAKAETIVAEVTLKVAFISKAAAKADVFANKAASEAAILPFTSAIAGVSTALAAALVEVSPVLAGLIPLFGAVASGVAAAAAARADMDSTSTRLAFRDSGVSKIAPLANVPSLFQNVLPPLFGSMLKTGADATGQSLQKAWSVIQREPGVSDPPSGPGISIENQSSGSVSSNKMQSTQLRKRDRVKNFISRRMGFQAA